LGRPGKTRRKKMRNLFKTKSVALTRRRHIRGTDRSGHSNSWLSGAASVVLACRETPRRTVSCFSRRITSFVGLLAIFWPCFDAPELLGAVTEQSFLAPESWAKELTSSKGWNPEFHPRMLADINGDNHKDVVGFGDAGVWVATSTGTNFVP